MQDVLDNVTCRNFVNIVFIPKIHAGNISMGTSCTVVMMSLKITTDVKYMYFSMKFMPCLFTNSAQMLLFFCLPHCFLWFCSFVQIVSLTRIKMTLWLTKLHFKSSFIPKRLRDQASCPWLLTTMQTSKGTVAPTVTLTTPARQMKSGGNIRERLRWKWGRMPTNQRARMCWCHWVWKKKDEFFRLMMWKN